MASSRTSEPWGLGKYILQFRAPIGLVLIAITAFMGYWAANVRIATSFENFFPSNHQNTLLYREISESIRRRTKPLCDAAGQAGRHLQCRDADQNPGHHATTSTSCRASITTRFFRWPPIAWPSRGRFRARSSRPTSCTRRCPRRQAELDDLRRNVMTHREPVQGLITYDDKGAMITASFNEQGLDYKELFDGIQDHRQ